MARLARPRLANTSVERHRRRVTAYLDALSDTDLADAWAALTPAQQAEAIQAEEGMEAAMRHRARFLRNNWTTADHLSHAIIRTT